MVEQFATAPVLAQLESMKDIRDGMDQEQWWVIEAEANKWHKMRQSNNVEDHAGCSWAVVYSHLSKVYNELYGKGGLKQNVQALRVMPSMLMNVACGAMHPGEELSSAPSVPALEHMAFGAMTHTEFKEFSDGKCSHAMMVAFNSPPATVDDFAKLINGRYIQGRPGLLFKGHMSGQHGKIKSKKGGLGPPVYPQRIPADNSLTKKRTDEKSRVLRPQKPVFKCTHCHKFSAHYVTQDWADTSISGCEMLEMWQGSQNRAGGGQGNGGRGHKGCRQNAADCGERAGSCSEGAGHTITSCSSIRRHARV